MDMRVTDSRSLNIARNVSATILAQVLIITFSFVNRTIFIKLLGDVFLGVDGLFTSILIVFSLAELGIGNAIIFSLYKPIAEGNAEKAKQYITLFAKAYEWVIGIVLAVGLALLPFISYIVKFEELTISINLNIVYIFFLINTVSSYFLAHYQTVLIVNQRQSTIALYNMVTRVIVLALESVMLVIFKNYYIYLLVKIVGNYAQAVALSVKAKSSHPELCGNSSEKLSKDELKIVKSNIVALFIRRVGTVVLLSTDNIIINGFIAVVMVGIYSNYTLIVNSIQVITVSAFSAMTATIGNYIAIESGEKREYVFRTYTFLTYLVYGFCSICLYVLTNRFIELLWGKEYLLSQWTLLLIVLNFFLYGFQSAINVFRDTTGAFVQGKYCSFVSAVVNVISSIILVSYMGVAGVILGTIISRIVVTTWYDPHILYKYFFKKSVRGYYLHFVIYTTITFSLCIIAGFTLSMLPNTLLYFAVCVGASFGFSLVLIVPFVRKEEFKECIRKIRGIYVKLIRTSQLKQH